MVDHRFEEPEEIDSVIRVAVEIRGDHRKGALEQIRENDIHAVLQLDIIAFDDHSKKRDHFGVSQQTVILAIVFKHLNAVVNEHIALNRVRFGYHTLEEFDDHFFDASNLLHRVEVEDIGVHGELAVDKLGVKRIEIHHIVDNAFYMKRVQKWGR